MNSCEQSVQRFAEGKRPFPARLEPLEKEVNAWHKLTNDNPSEQTLKFNQPKWNGE